MTTVSVLVPRAPVAPRGAELAADAFAWMTGRVESFLRRRPLTRAEEAERVRALARSLENSEPSHAADLYAMVARYESE
jgi:hypothetical protein